MPKVREEGSPQDRISHEKLTVPVRTAKDTLEWEDEMTANMIIAREHQGLAHIDEVEPFDAERDQPLFDEIKQVLSRHGALHRFGVVLLHKHFDVCEQERMVEVSDGSSRSLIIRPTRELPKEGETYVQTNWRFDLDDPTASQLCFADCLRSGGGKHHEIHKKR